MLDVLWINFQSSLHWTAQLARLHTSVRAGGLQSGGQIGGRLVDGTDLIAAGVGQRELEPDELIIFPNKNLIFSHNRFSTLLFSMKMAELGKVVSVSWIIDFEDIC